MHTCPLTRNVFLSAENTEDLSISSSLLTTLDGHGIFFSGYTRGAVVDRNEFVSIGETAVNQWGYTDGSPVPGMGWDARAGNQPRGTRVTENLVHEIGLWTKQNSFYFQSESFNNVIEGNIAYNGPRAGVNFDDGLGGGSVVTRNVLFNFCRESSDVRVLDLKCVRAVSLTPQAPWNETAWPLQQLGPRGLRVRRRRARRVWWLRNGDEEE